MVWIRKNRTKYNNTKSQYNGQFYHSQKEALKARELDLLIKAGKIKSWKSQVRIPLDVNGVHICRYVCDFLITHNDNSLEYLEVKGFWTATAKLKVKLFKALYPELKYTIE